MAAEIQKDMNQKMEKTIRVLKDELHSIRAGRANPVLLDQITVEYYGSSTPLKQLAAISVPEPRLLQIQPYDTTVLSDIEKAINMSDLGLNPQNDGKVIRLSIPMLTEERRKELTKAVKKTGEDAKVALRNERREANEKFKKMNKAKEITDDDLKAYEDDVQKATDKFVKMVDELVAQKEAEVMEV
ncbi:MAG: ribosome recycling factor [Clostridia bacterium]|nr:ribosome recycling factor [Clostridia bacterium]